MAQSDRATILSRIRRMVAEVGGASDAQLLERFATQRDEAAFELLLWRHARLVFGVCQRVLHDEHDAEDAFQASFLALARHAGRIARKEAVAGWLHRVAHRAALALRRQRARRNAREKLSNEAQALASAAAVDASAENQELRQILDHEIGRLPERFRAVVVVCYLEGKSVDEAAMRLGCPRGTVASRLARGRERLRSRLLQRGLIPAAALAGFTQANAASFPLSLIPTLTAAALRFTAPGGAIDGVVSPRIAALTHEVLRAMFLHRLKTAAVLITFIGLLLAGGGVSVALYAGGTPEAQPPDKAQSQETSQTKQTGASRNVNRPPVVTVSRPVQRTSAPYELYTGRLAAVGAVEVRPAVTGTVEKICFKPGAEVKKGDVLFALDPRTFQLALDKAEAELALAQAKNKRDEPAQKLAKANPSLPEFDKVREQAAIIEAQIRLAKIAVEHARLNLNATQIRAPMAGQVGRSLVELGSEVFHGPDRATLLTTISRLDPIGFAFEMDERSFVQFQRWWRERPEKKSGVQVCMQLSGEEGFPHTGTLDGFDHQVNPTTGTVRMHGSFPNPDQLLLPGMYAHVRVTVGKAQAVLEIPQDAIEDDRGLHYVLVVGADNIIQRRMVHLAWMDNGLRVIEAGLHPNDRVVIAGPVGLHPGVQIQPREKARPARSDSNRAGHR